jgi:hypothetical protein
MIQASTAFQRPHKPDIPALTPNPRKHNKPVHTQPPKSVAMEQALLGVHPTPSCDLAYIEAAAPINPICVQLLHQAPKKAV